MKNYIPKHKTDLKAVECLLSLPFENIKNDTLELLVSIQDMHWDIAHDVASYFAPHVNEIKKELLFILQTSDEEWKYNVIRWLLAYSPDKLDQSLIKVIKKIAKKPTKAEKDELVNFAAKEVLKNKFLVG